jgi:hypothetical protein
VTITGLSTVTQSLATPNSAAPDAGVGAFAYRASGSYGGGYALIDNPYNIGMYSVNGTLNFSFGTSGGALASRATLDASGNFAVGGSVTGTAISGTTGSFSGAVTATGYNGITYTNVIGAIGFTPVQQGGGTAQSNNKIFLGWGASAGDMFLQVDSTSFGRDWPMSARYAVGGSNQSWQKPARSSGTTYTNSTGQAIQVHVVFGGGTGGGGYMTVGGTVLGQGSSNQGSTSVSVIVPNGVTYSATATLVGITDWAELR